MLQQVAAKSKIKRKDKRRQSMSVEMKDSGIAWIGEIPKHWEVTMLKRLLQINNGADYKAIESDSGIPVIGSGGQFAWAKKYMYDGEVVLLGRKGTIDKPLYYKGKFWAVDTMFYSIPTDKTIGKFAYYISNCLPFKVYSTSTALPSMTQTILGNMNVVLPSKEEQSRIANFLDKKCAEIDELIALQEQMIAQLNTYKQAVITETVTKGLNPNVKMKDSGVEWIGEIPEHWDVCKIQYMANLKSGYNLTTEQITDEGLYPVYGGNGIRGFYHEFFNDGEYVLIGRQGALCGNINYSTGKFWATEHAVICYPKMQYATKWLGELLRSMNLNQYSLASAQPGLAVERIKALSIPLPPLSEQQSIAQYLDQKCKEIDELISIKKEKIEHLKAYKKSVIYEYVTGKKQVSDN